MRVICLAALSLAGAACSTAGPGAADRATDPKIEAQPAARSAGAADPAGPVISHIQFRDRVLVVRAGAGEPHFDVTTRAGGLLASSLTRTDLDRQFPAIADRLRQSIALGLDARLDARLEPNR